MLFRNDKIGIETHVKRILTSMNLDKVNCLDLMTVLVKMKALFPGFNYRRLPDHMMGGRQAFFEYGLNVNVITLSESVYRGMNAGDKVSMRIVAEEIGHFFLGHKHTRNHSDVRSAVEKTVFQIQKDEAEAEYFASCLIP